MAPDQDAVHVTRPPFGVFTTDLQLVVRTWDPFLAAITGVAPERALNRAIAEVLPGAEARGLLTVMQRVASSGMVEVLAPALHRYLIACPPADGAATSERMQQRITIGPVRQDGHTTGVAVTIENVTSRVEAEKAFA